MKKFTLLLAAMLLSVMSFAEWQRVTTVAELLQGGTMIIGYEATANSGVIVPMRTEGTATTSDAGYMYSGTTAGTSTKNTVDMSAMSVSAGYEVTIVPSTSVTGAVCIKIGDNFLGNTNTKNNCQLFTTESTTTAFTPKVGTNDVFTLKIAANTGNTTNYTTLQYNTNSPRFAVYDGKQKNVVIYKKVENTNPLLTCEESVAFGNISSLVGTIPSKTLKVTAKNLTEDITVTLSEGAAFTLDKTNFDARNGGSIEITPVLTVGENTATLTLTSGEKSVEVALSATIQQAYTISWSVNGKVTSTSAVIKGENLVLPASPEAPNDCASKVFVGWATTPSVAADGTGIVFVDAATPATADATYYAVFATATESTPATASVTFSDMFSGKTTNGSKDIDGEALDITDGITVTFAKSSSSSNKAKYYDNGKAVRLYGGGSITINSIATITSFTLTFGSGGGTNEFTADCGTWASPTWTGEAKTIVLTESGTSDNRRIAGISVSYKQTAWEDYATTCDDTPSAINSAAVETPAVKTIENGQLIILRDGVKYNAMGVRLQ